MMSRILILLMAFGLYAVNVLLAQTRETITFSEQFVSDVTTVAMANLSPQEERFNSNSRGVIKLEYEGSVPDSVKISAQAAARAWELYLDSKAEVYIQIKMVSNLDDVDIATDVDYIYRYVDNVSYPQALYRYLGFMGNTTDLEDSEGFLYDAVVKINKDTKWNCSFEGDGVPGTKSLSYAMMRAIASTLGFGSCVRLKGTDFRLGQNGAYSVFDKCIVSSSERLFTSVSLSNKSEFKSYVQPQQGESLYALKQEEAYALYAPPVFENYKSLRYMNSPSSLMYYNLQEGVRKMQVDDVTLDLLRHIGWDIKNRNEVEIIADDIPESGLTSAYTGHFFSVKNNTVGTLKNGRWSCLLQKEQGVYSQVAEGGGTTFAIPAIENVKQYYHDIDGSIPGRVVFEAEVENRKVEAVYNLSLSLKPEIDTVYLTRLKYDDDGYYYTINFTVKYKGSDYVYIALEEEYNPSLRCQFIYEPFFAYGSVDRIKSYVYVWLNVTVLNDYGEVEYIVEIPPFPEEISKPKNVLTIMPERLRTLLESFPVMSFNTIRVYDKNGVYVKSIKGKDEMYGWKSGLYYLKYFRDDVLVETEKYVIP